MSFPIVISARLMLFVWLLASAMAMMGLLAIWAGLNRRHWFAGAAAIGAALALLAPVPAFDLMLVFLTQALVIWVPLRLARLIGWPRPPATANEHTSSRKFRLTLKDLFLFVLTAAGLMQFAIHVPGSVREKAGYYLLCGACAGCASLAACTAVLTRWPIAVRLPLAIVLPLAVAGLLATMEFGATDPFAERLLDWAGYPEWLWCAVLPLTACLIAVGLVIARQVESVCAFAARPDGPPTRSTWLARACLVAFVAAVSAVPSVAYLQMMHVPPAPDAPMPEPNGYQTLLRIGTELESVSAPDASAATTAQLRRFVINNKTRLKAIREALDQDWRATVSYDPDEWDTRGVSALRETSKALMAEAQLHERSGDDDAAAETYVAIVRLGQAARRGGLLIDWLLSVAVSGTGIDELARLRTALSPGERRSVIKHLVAVEQRTEPFQEVVQHERIWQQRAEGWRARIAFLQPELPSPMHQEIEWRFLANLRLLMCDLAVRSFVYDHGALPERLDRLVPDYVPAAGEDPFSGQQLLYQHAGEDFVLYSVGPDETDNGGRAAAGPVPTVGEDSLLPLPADVMRR